MFEYLSEIKSTIYKRYITVEGNIKSKSNSFYDAYLDLLETTLKVILDNGDIEYKDSKTCGYILRTNSVKVYLLNKIRIDQKTYEKLLDYTKKVNDHKHKKEKNITVDSVTNLMKIYYDFSSAYAKYIGVKNIEEFDRYYFYRSFDATSKENIEIKDDVENLKVRLDKIEKEKTNDAFESKTVLDKQFSRNNKEIDVKFFALSAKKEYIYNASDNEYRESIRKIKILFLVALALDVIATIILSVTLKTYCVSSLIDNIWLISIVIAVIKLNCIDKNNDQITFSNLSIMKFEINQEGTLITTFDEKRRYKWLRYALYIFSLFNFLIAISEVRKFNIFLCIVYIVVLISLDVIAYYLSKKIGAFYFTFHIIKYSNKLDGKDVSYYLSLIDNKVYTEEQFENGIYAFNRKN